MRLIKDDHRVCIVDVEGTSDFIVNEVVVRHKDQVSALDSVSSCIVWTELVAFCLLVNVFNIERLPRHVGSGIGAIFKEYTLATSLKLLSRSTRGVQCSTFVDVNAGIDAQMITRCDEDCARLEDRVFAFLLHLSKLRVRTATVDYLR